MPKFKYKGIGGKGGVVTGTVVAVSRIQAKRLLKENKVTVTSIKQQTEIDWTKMIYGEQVPVTDLIMFTRLLSGALKNGMTLKEGLEVIYRQTKHPVMKNMVTGLLADVKSGVDLSEAVKKFPKIFPNYYAPLVQAGEEIGDLQGVLEQIGDYTEKVFDIKKQIKGMLSYPISVLVMGILLVVVILIKVIPTFEKTFAQMKGALPMPTVILQNISNFFTGNWQMILGVIVAIGVAGFAYYQVDKGKRFFAYVVLKIPLFGPIVTAMAIISFLKTMSTLVSNGVPIVQTLSIVEQSIGNLIIRNVVGEMRKNVVRGLPMSDPIKAHGKIFPPMVGYAVEMGEKSGNLADVLSKTAQFYDKQIMYELKDMAGKVNPILTGFIGGMVLWVALAIYLPMFQMMQGVH